MNLTQRNYIETIIATKDKNKAIRDLTTMLHGAIIREDKEAYIYIKNAIEKLENSK